MSLTERLLVFHSFVPMIIVSSTERLLVFPALSPHEKYYLSISIMQDAPLVARFKSTQGFCRLGKILLVMIETNERLLTLSRENQYTQKL